MEEKNQKDLICDGEIQRKEQKDAELDKKIQALRKKNEALIRRHQEIEEDKRNAEKGGMGVTPRKAKQESLTITITKEKRSEGWMNTDDSEDEEEQKITFCMGNKMQLAVTVDSKVKSKRFVTKKVDQDDHVTSDLSGLDEEQVDHLFTYGRGRRMQMAIITEQEKGKKKAATQRSRLEKACNRDENKMMNEECPKNYSNLSMAANQNSEYQQWKKEREQIDFDRVARQRNSRGEWRRAWDIDKKEHMFEDDAIPDRLSGWIGTEKQMSAQTENVTKTLPTISSKAKGKDRLTGRAQRWDNMEGNVFSSVLEEFSMQKGRDFHEAPQRLKVRVMEGKCPTIENSEPSKQKRSLENKQKTENGSLKLESAVLGACHDTCSQEKKLSGDLAGGMGLEDKCEKQLQDKQVEEFFPDLAQVDSDTTDYLSVLNSERQPVSLGQLKPERPLLVREDSAQQCGDKQCAKPQVDCY
ncbi:coiled-coil domain-containing protein 9B [Spea bombifrons]|uniref:coiled-coil domain-containing protein 9B n=1 Tax=Spea bombifrons TaxID=233779 RepID=UPI00234B9545|nr:coiled-coil domain-containing protein 9B [Spea bombifrons]